MGTLTVTTDKGLLANANCYGFKPIAIVESESVLGLPTDTIQIASILLPSYDAVSAYLDGNLSLFQSMYFGQLSGRNCDEFITLIMLALYRGNNILIYIDSSEVKELPYPKVLSMYLENIYGYYPQRQYQGDQNILGEYIHNPAYDTFIMCKLYQYSFVDSEEFLNIYPPNIDIPYDVVNKLMYEESPMIVNPTPESCKAYFMEAVRNKHGIFNKKKLFTFFKGGNQK